jgi:hypothetical protein
MVRSAATPRVSNHEATSRRSPDERSDIRGPINAEPGFRFAHPGYDFCQVLRSAGAINPITTSSVVMGPRFRGDDAVSIPRQQFAKTVPGLAIKTHELHLVDGDVIGR